MRVAVLGGGFQGCCIALTLASRGARVVLFERRDALMQGAATNNEGKIQLILRNSSDQQVAPTPGRELRQIYGLAKEEPPPSTEAKVRYRPETPRPETPRPAPTPPPPTAVPKVLEPPSDGIIIIRGNQKVIESFEPIAGGSK